MSKPKMEGLSLGDRVVVVVPVPMAFPPWAKWYAVDWEGCVWAFHYKPKPMAPDGGPVWYGVRGNEGLGFQVGDWGVLCDSKGKRFSPKNPVSPEWTNWVFRIPKK